MSIWRRVRDMTAATLNEMLESSDDPVRLIDRFLSGQREQLEQSQALYRQLLHHAATLRQQMVQAEQLRDKREQQASLAVKAGEEIAARMALQEKLRYEEQALQYRRLYEESQPAIIELEERMQALKAEYDEVLAKREVVLARLESLRLQRKMQAGPGWEGRSSHGLLYRVEDAVSELESEMRIFNELRSTTPFGVRPEGSRYAAPPASPVMPGASAAVDRELEKLRSKLAQEGWN
ncbi:PspA/IM30 family protein [Paenibacillus sp. y28]|uniref:PspA/IM30 family protein n=1 Tax=Paenibacillus sp. y28 TaxID=3129110 RepID=UPI003016BBF6